MADVNINFTGDNDNLEKNKKVLQDMLKLSLGIKKNLGNAVNIKVPAAAIAIEKVGTGNENVLNDLIKKLEGLK